MKANRARSFRHKLVRFQLLLTLIALVACSGAFIINDLFIFKRAVERSLISNAKILNLSLAPALEFGDAKEAEKVLKSLTAEPCIVSARVTDRSGQTFAHFELEDKRDPLPFESELMSFGSKFEDGFYYLNYPIGEGDEVLGYLLLKSDLSEFTEAYRNYLWIVMAMFAASLLISYTLTHVVQGALSQPIIDFATTAKRISESGNYALRLKHREGNRGIEEVEALTSEFNNMLGQIEARDQKIHEANADLEKKVRERTVELESIQRVALANAHEAGMAEIATGILHNIGNITNSINASAEELHRIVQGSRISTFLKANEIVRENLGNAEAFFASDPRGKILPEFYVKTGEAMAKEYEQMKEEISGIGKKIALVRDVVHTQQEYAKKGLFVETIDLAEVTDEILDLHKTSLSRHEVQVKRNYIFRPSVRVQKVKFAHILMNLVKNAKEAMKDMHSERELTAEIGVHPGKGIYLMIKDTGEGIAAENLEKIFTHGFTTKDDGHGFGLHFCANAMKEMGGRLAVLSDGPGRGSSFILYFKKLEEDRKYA